MSFGTSVQPYAQSQTSPRDMVETMLMGSLATMYQPKDDIREAIADNVPEMLEVGLIKNRAGAVRESVEVGAFIIEKKDPIILKEDGTERWPGGTMPASIKKNVETYEHFQDLLVGIHKRRRH